MGKWVFIPFVGCQNTIDRGVDIHVPWVGGSIYHVYGGRYTMGRESKYHG